MVDAGTYPAPGGQPPEVMAPLSLLVDAFTLPMDAFLTPGVESDDAVLVHPLTDDGYQNAVSIPVATLALLTVELVLNAEQGVLDNVDIIDIPVPSLTPDTPLWASKCRWLLENYRQHRQPDILLVCNATAQRAAIPSTARALLRWVNDTQPTQENKLPGWCGPLRRKTIVSYISVTLMRRFNSWLVNQANIGNAASAGSQQPATVDGMAVAGHTA